MHTYFFKHEYTGKGFWHLGFIILLKDKRRSTFKLSIQQKIYALGFKKKSLSVVVGDDKKIKGLEGGVVVMEGGRLFHLLFILQSIKFKLFRFPALARALSSCCACAHS